MAFDYRLRYYFAATPSGDLAAAAGAYACTDLLGDDLPPAFLHRTDAALHALQPVGRRLERPQEELLARHCIVLALFEEVYRAGLWPGSPLASSRPTSLESLLAIAPDVWVDDVCALSWAFYDRFTDLLAHPAVLNPTFEGSFDVGGADADLILDDCLVDIKATIRQGLNGMWLHQLLGYVLLDYSDRYAIRSVGIYLARQQTLLRWPLASLMAMLASSEAPPLEDLRERFRAVAQGAHAATRRSRLAGTGSSGA